MAVTHVTRAIGTTVVFSALALSAHVVLPDKIRVYTGNINASGEFRLELHVNTIPNGIGTPNYPGEVTTLYGWCATAESPYDLTPSLEPGLYVSTTFTRENTFHVTGPKARMRWIPVRSVDGVGNPAGINIELAHVAGCPEAPQNAVELRSTYGYQNDRWLQAVNPVLGWNLSGDGRSGVPEATPSSKITRTIVTGVRAGTEYYAGPGPINHIAPLHEQ